MNLNQLTGSSIIIYFRSHSRKSTSTSVSWALLLPLRKLLPPPLLLLSLLSSLLLPRTLLPSLLTPSHCHNWISRSPFNPFFIYYESRSKSNCDSSSYCQYTTHIITAGCLKHYDVKSSYI